MIAAPLHFAGERLLLDPTGALIWPEAGLLVVADLHLEKATAAARRGSLLPPWDTRITLDRLWQVLRRWRPRVLVALGDSFHDARAAARLPAAERARLVAITTAHDTVWVAGNHDPGPPAGLPGTACSEFAHRGLVFRHQAELARIGGEAELARVGGGAELARIGGGAELARVGGGAELALGGGGAELARGGAGAERTLGGEVSAHFHPKARVLTRAGAVSRPCFVASSQRLLLPAFGAYAGGLDVTHPALAALFPRGGRVFMLGRERLFSFPLAQAERTEPATTRRVAPPVTGGSKRTSTSPP